ncbi:MULTISPECIES: competence/damage-inducible protein A [Dictyoglomus]|jgi:nicotinamide-nucleotide amidase|uniref:CinA-like protein n=1 Tax=Dictyoglomus turgidum (strain DSM 6724 / Z-1310) TaxID=515635 RepID=CINAL_DICTD|nr:MULTISPECIES: competence/damage-inducible protein A [Dictyoglomus]B8DYM0.1 RecName: Full=CinA-like protein [Dictyoglomus turgidum DSM 6724]ACK41402.1 competence/damage-inducible protein CinA [Dictyoglomus turgidum DSM 6724]PNV81012.1 MAG: cinA-like protein [Dictyoglomus turgidum]HBU31593.1 competence/damage-inducible protein A [Dictyoglomus sp.]
MRCEILSVGTELLLGDILNTNAQYLSRRLADLGIPVYFHTTVGDNPERLKKALEIAFSRSDMVIATGGLGPTQDDLTKEISAEFFNKKLVLHEESLKRIKEFFERRGLNLTEGNIKQAYIIEGSRVIPNDWGTAPGIILEEGGKILILLPGPPKEMIPMFETYVVPYLSTFSSGIIYSKVLRVCGIGESFMEEKVKDLIKSQTNPTIAPYAKEGEAILRITARAKSKEEAEKMIEGVVKEIRKRLGDYIYGEGETSLEEVVVNLLLEKGLTISVAESCTGGLISARLVNVPGVSKVFKGSIIAYDNEVKIKELNVPEEIFKEYGAVSSQCAMKMAEGIAKKMGTDVGLSATGIAGPEGGTLEKPIGLVYIGLYIRGEMSYKELRLSGDRNRIRLYTTINGLDLLRRGLLNL